MEGGFVPRMRMILKWNVPGQDPIENKPRSEAIVTSQRSILFWQKLNILRKKGKFNFKTIMIGQDSVFILPTPNVHSCIKEKENYHHDLAEPRRQRSSSVPLKTRVSASECH
jgi:hypothetical protein